MQRPIITIPPKLLRHASFAWDIDWRGQSASTMTEGTTRTVFSGFPRWVGSPQVALHGEGLRVWRALRARAQGRRGIYRVTMVDPVGFAMTDAGASQAVVQKGIPFSNGARFSTGFGFAYEPFAMSVGEAGPGAQVLRIDTTSAHGYVPRAGQIMSHDDWPFMVTNVLPVSGAVYDLEVQMPLRAAIPAGAEVLLRGVGRFEAMEAGMGAPSYGLGRVARPTLSFMEVLAR